MFSQKQFCQLKKWKMTTVDEILRFLKWSFGVESGTDWSLNVFKHLFHFINGFLIEFNELLLQIVHVFIHFFYEWVHVHNLLCLLRARLILLLALRSVKESLQSLGFDAKQLYIFGHLLIVDLLEQVVDLSLEGTALDHSCLVPESSSHHEHDLVELQVADLYEHISSLIDLVLQDLLQEDGLLLLWGQVFEIEHDVLIDILVCDSQSNLTILSELKHDVHEQFQTYSELLALPIRLDSHIQQEALYLSILPYLVPALISIGLIHLLLKILHS